MSKEISVMLKDVTGKTWSFTELRSLKEFCLREAEFWQEKSDAIEEAHPYIKFSAEKLQTANTIESQMEQLEKLGENPLKQQLNSLLKSFDSNWLWSGHPYVGEFIQVNKKVGKSGAEAFVQFWTRGQIQNLNRMESFLGTMKGYEFKEKNANPCSREEGEEASQNLLIERLDHTRTKLYEEVEGFKRDFNSWGDENTQSWDALRDKSQEDQKVTMEVHCDQFRNSMAKWEAHISELEKTYEEKLRLEKPARYWKNAADKYKKQGYIAVGSLALCVVVGLGGIGYFFSGWLSGEPAKLGLHSLQGIVLFGTLLSIYAFFIKVLSRLTFSSFHLMRDAEEREQLTYLYLSLVKDKVIDEGSRSIILQSLFSRTETGLLAVESGPTMPGLSDIMKAGSKVSSSSK